MEPRSTGTIAPLKNVALCIRAMEQAHQRLIYREDHEPGIICLYGPAGFGKTFAITHIAIKYRACFIQCRSTWTKKAILSAMAQDLGVKPAKTAAELTAQVGTILVERQTPLVVDEMDYIIGRDATDIIRDLYEIAHVPILLAGEESLPTHLDKTERFYSRVFEWIPAQKADTSDARVLTQFYSKRVKIADDLLAEVTKRSQGSLRRISVNLTRIEEEAIATGKAAIDLPEWVKMNKGFWTGEAIVRKEYIR